MLRLAATASLEHLISTLMLEVCRGPARLGTSGKRWASKVNHGQGMFWDLYSHCEATHQH